MVSQAPAFNKMASTREGGLKIFPIRVVGREGGTGGI